MYFDTAYIVKFYLNDRDSAQVRTVVNNADVIGSSYLAFAEFHGAVHRRLREQSLTAKMAQALAKHFLQHVEDGLWTLHPVTDAALRRTSTALLSLPASVFLRTADAIHLTTARDAGETEIWTSDRHMIAAAPHFGLKGRSV